MSEQRISQKSTDFSIARILSGNISPQQTQQLSTNQLFHKKFPTNHNFKTSYNSETNYNSETSYNSETNYNSETSYNSEINYNSETSYNLKTNYKSETSYNSETNYSSETKQKNYLQTKSKSQLGDKKNQSRINYKSQLEINQEQIDEKQKEINERKKITQKEEKVDDDRKTEERDLKMNQELEGGNRLAINRSFEEELQKCGASESGSKKLRLDCEAILKVSKKGVDLKEEDGCFGQLETQLPWLQCTRYSPPKLPRRPSAGKQKKRRLGSHPRIPFTKFQIQVLEEKYKISAYLSRRDVTHLGGILNLPQNRVKIWFQNRRARERKESQGLGT